MPAVTVAPGSEIGGGQTGAGFCRVQVAGPTTRVDLAVPTAVPLATVTLTPRQAGVLELHTWGCHEEKLAQPDQLVMDFDPDPAVPWSEVTRAAIELRER